MDFHASARAELVNGSPRAASPSSSAIAPGLAVLAIGAWRDGEMSLLEFLSGHGCSVRQASPGSPATAAGASSLGLALINADIARYNDTDAKALLRDLGAVSCILIADPGESPACLAALEHFADDFLLRPVHPRELLARIRSVWRGRGGGRASSDGANYAFAGYRLDARRHSLHRPDGDDVPLNHHAFRLLQALLDNAGRVLSREDLLTALNGPDQGASGRAIDIHVMRLRRRLGGDGPRLVRTVHGHGYQFVGSVERY